jgi:flagellar biosynthesis/type III secretory pathway protein FliH
LFKVNTAEISVVPLTLTPLEDNPRRARREDMTEDPSVGASPPPAESEEIEKTRRRAERELESARAEADAIRSAARSEAETIRRDAEREAERARADAEKRGYNEGYADGEKKAKRDGENASKARLEELDKKNSESIGELFSSVNRELGEARAALAENVRGLSMDIARRIVGDALREDKNLLSMINKAVTGLDSEHGFTVRVSPETAKRLFPDGSVTLTADGRSVKATVIPDVTLTEYGLLIDFGGADKTVRADAGAETQLDAAEEALSKLEENDDGDA